MAALGVAAPTARASLSVPNGTPLPAFTGTGTTGAANALRAFEAAVGGRDNGTTAGEQGNGFRYLNWDGLAVNGTDPTSRTIESQRVVGLDRGRLEPWGIEQSADVAVANDDFSSTNGSVNFAPFSHPNVWAPYNSNTAQFEVVAPAVSGSIPVPAQTRGLGVVFLNVTTGGTTIQYYNGDIPLGQVTAPVDAGGPSFAGMLFPGAVVTRVVITLGTASIFAFDGNSVTQALPGPDVVAGDDVALAEPAAAIGTLTATAGIPVTSVLDTFTESSANATITAVIDWGDGSRTGGTVTPGSGGTFIVTGNHAYAKIGSYIAQVTVDDFGGPEQTKQTDIDVGPRATATGVNCSPDPVAVTASTTCTATVSDATGGSPSSPSGMIFFSSTTPGGVFPQNAGCLLGPSTITGLSTCAVQFSPGQLPPLQAHVAAAYGGDAAHAGSGGVATVGVHAQHCSLRALTRRLRPAGLGVLVSCDARSGVQISVKALASRNRRLKAFQLPFGSLRASVVAGRPTVLVIKPAPGVLKLLHAALRRGQHVSLKLTLTAGSHATHRTTTTRVRAIRIA